MEVERAFIFLKFAVILLSPTLCEGKIPVQNRNAQFHNALFHAWLFWAGLQCITCNSYENRNCLIVPDPQNLTKACPAAGKSRDSSINSTEGEFGDSNKTSEYDYFSHTPDLSPAADLPSQVCFTKRVLSVSGMNFEYGDKGCQTKHFYECLLKQDDIIKSGTHCVRIQTDWTPPEVEEDEKCDDDANEDIMKQALEQARLGSIISDLETIEYCFCGTDNCNGKSHGGFGRRSSYPNNETTDDESAAVLPRLSIWATAAGLVYTFYYYH